ncbi:DUF6166 domain-containing protein [Saccharomonospora azurea]
MTDRPKDRVYHGINGNAEGHDTRIQVVKGGGGFTEREPDHVTALYELDPQKPFWWGYTGSGPGRTAAAIIDDILPDLVAADPVLGDLDQAQRSQLVVAFLTDVVGHLHNLEEFWLSSQSVLRWTRGYLREQMTA